MDKPIKHSYCVIPDKAYAGEYVGDLQNPEQKIRRLEEFGITHFVDLTEEGELNPYQHLLDSYVEHHRFPIRDVSVPKSYREVYDLMEHIDSILSNDDNKVYVHCWGGVGRTGTIVACLYEYYGESFEDAVNHLRQSFQGLSEVSLASYSRDRGTIGFYPGIWEFFERGYKKQLQEYAPENINSLKPNEVFVFGKQSCRASWRRCGSGCATKVWCNNGARRGTSRSIIRNSYSRCRTWLDSSCRESFH